MKTKVIIAAILIFGYVIFIVPRIWPDVQPDTSVEYSKPEPANDLEDPTPSSEPLSDNQAFNFGGEWRGVLKPTHGAHLDPRDWNLELRFFVKGNEVQVFIHRGNDNWQEVKAGKFRITQEKSNALIYSLDSGGGWAESWVFSLSRRDDDSIFVYGNRVINNFKQAPDQQGARITYGATSVFQRSYDRFTKKTGESSTLTEEDIAQQFKEALERGKRLAGVKQHGSVTLNDYKILQNKPDFVVLGVDYTYGGLDEDKVWVGAITLTDGRSNGHWSYRPAKLLRGTNKASVRISVNDRAPDNYCSDMIRIQFYVGGKGTFMESDIPFEKCWQKKTG